MPSIYSTIVEKEQSITRPAIYAIVDQIKEITKISKDVQVRFTGDINKQQSNSSGIDDNKDRFTKFNSDRYIFIEVDEDFDKESVGTTSNGKNEHNPIFLDKNLYVVINPIYYTSNVNINFKFRTTSKNEAIAWRDDIRVHVSRMRDVNLHKIDYHYSIPDHFLEVIKEIHRLRENYLPYGDSLHQYLLEHSVDRVKVIGDITGTDFEYAIAETQIRILGKFDFDVLPDKIEREDENGVYEISFSYSFNYQKPMACYMKYPISVHNQLLDFKYVSFTNYNYQPDKEQARFSRSLGALYNFESNKIIGDVHRFEGAIKIPHYDDFLIPHKQIASATIFTALIEVDTTDNKTLLNLYELGDFMLDKDLLDWIKNGEYLYICDIYKSILNISLYRNDYLVRDNSLYCDSSLNIISKQTLNLRNQYRIRMSIIIDISILKYESIYRVIKNKKIIQLILPELNAYINNSPDFEPLKNHLEGNIPEFYLSVIYRLLINGVYNLPTGLNYSLGLGLNTLHPSVIYDSNGVPSEVGAFRGLDPDIVEEIRKNRISLNTVQVTGCIAEMKVDN